MELKKIYIGILGGLWKVMDVLVCSGPQRFTMSYTGPLYITDGILTLEDRVGSRSLEYRDILGLRLTLTWNIVDSNLALLFSQVWGV